MENIILLVGENSEEMIGKLCDHLGCDPSELKVIEPDSMLKARHIDMQNEVAIIGHHHPIDPIMIYHKMAIQQAIDKKEELFVIHDYEPKPFGASKPTIKKECKRHLYKEHAGSDGKPNYWQCNCGKYLL